MAAKPSGQIDAVIFDVGKVLYEWEPRLLYERLIEDDRALDAFLREVVTHDWHFQHDAGRDFAETSAELIAQYPQHEALIRAWGPRFHETLRHRVPGMYAIVADLDAAGVPLFALTNFSHEFWPPFRATDPQLFDRFRDVLVSGEEKLAKPDPAIYRLALARFGLAAEATLFIDDREENIAAAEALGIVGHLFRDAAILRDDLAARGIIHPRSS